MVFVSHITSTDKDYPFCFRLQPDVKVINTMSDVKADPKIIDLIKQKQAGNKPFASIEYFPPRTEEGVKVRILLIFDFFRS